MGEKIKECPFCDGSDIRFTNHGRIGTREHSGMEVWSMCCYSCGATFPNRYSKQGLVDSWNQRSGETTRLAAKIIELTAEVLRWIGRVQVLEAKLREIRGIVK